MKNYEKYSNQALEKEKKELLEQIEDWERTLRTTRSFLIQISLRHYIKNEKVKIHAIEAEMAYRKQCNDNI